MSSFIRASGIRVHNLKNIQVAIPKNQMTVITGVSGSGKSSLAFDTLFAEGQRRYMEGLSSYSRQFIDQIPKPDLDSISGLSPTISIDQKTSNANIRSTLGTLTNLYDYLRILFTHVAEQKCSFCHTTVQPSGLDNIFQALLSLPSGSAISIYIPLVEWKKGSHQKIFKKMLSLGFEQGRLNQKDCLLEELIKNPAVFEKKRSFIEVLIDRILVKPQTMERIKKSITLASTLTANLITVCIKGSEPLSFSKKASCTCQKTFFIRPKPNLFSFNSPSGACSTCHGLGILENDSVCATCHGARLSEKSLQFYIDHKNIAQVSQLDMEELKAYLHNLRFTQKQKVIAIPILAELYSRIDFLTNVGLGYLSLNRSSTSLSGGELQRVRLAAQVGSNLIGITYVLDEPSIGLHQHDNQKLLLTLKQLKERGNTVILVEHDEETIQAADYIIDLGPHAGAQGGYVVAQGSYQSILHSGESLTAAYLNKKIKPFEKKTYRKPKDFISLYNAHQHHLKNLNVDFPLQTLTCVTGVSGCGKSTLIIDTLYQALKACLNNQKIQGFCLDKISGWKKIDKIIEIDQKSTGSHARSNPATYIGVFSAIRDFFASRQEAKIRGYTSSVFSFNTSGGRCESCKGSGEKILKMHFLPDAYIPCDQCYGKRYKPEILDIKYENKSIADILSTTITDAIEIFDAIAPIRRKLEVLQKVGLGYLKLGQSLSSLSGGEAQRLKISEQLCLKSTGSTLYILDEPSTGLHFDDVKKLILALEALVEEGNTVIIIEHNLDMIQAADHIIDMGPHGGKNGGYILATGTPKQIAKSPKSLTGKYLAQKNL